MKPSVDKDYIETKQYKQINKGARYFIVAYGDNLQWVEQEVNCFLSLWDKGVSIENIAVVLRRPLHEIVYLITYLDSPRNGEDPQCYAKECKKLFNRRESGCLDQSVYQSSCV